jgi:trehalose/maltose hydrolase-like predicted phosphorylase
LISHSAFPVEPWSLRETHLDLDLLAQAESLFALSNGHIGLRGNLDEGEPHGIPGTYVNSFYEERPLPYAEVAYGFPESSQTIVNATNGKIIRLLVDDEPLDVRYGQLHSHTRVLDLRAGTLRRELDWTSPANSRIKVRSTRLVSFRQRAVAAIEYVVEAVDNEVRLIVQSELIANEFMPEASKDPRDAAALGSPLVAIDQDMDDSGATLVHETRVSGLRIAAGMDHVVEGDAAVEVALQTRLSDDWARTSLVCTLKPGQRLRLIKFLSYGWSAVRSASGLRDQVAGALTGARSSGFDGLLQEQRDYLDAFWDVADVQVDGDPEIQQAVRFSLFHVLQAGERAERRCIPAKGLTGPGYDGHTFWDAEGFVIPMLAFTSPRAAADALRWRHSTLDAARERAAALGLQGAAFPWRTIAGPECSGYWPAGTAAVHVNGDIAAAVERYRLLTGDDQIEREVGLELLVETARLWMSLGNHDADGAWHVVGVTGPDEYTAIVADNVFTNLVAAENLLAAADAALRHPDLSRGFGVDSEEIAGWRDAAAAVYIPYDNRLRVHQQSANFTQLPEWDFERNTDYPLLLSAPYFDLYRKQVIKQADLELAMLWFGDRFSAHDKARNVDYYERRTVRDSSLSACVQAVLAAEVGHLELAYDYTYEACAIDLLDLHHNTRDGLHIASLAGAWTALVAGFGGLRHRGEQLLFDPHLPQHLTRLHFKLRYRGRCLSVDIEQEAVTYTVEGDGPSVQIWHAGQQIDLPADVSQKHRIHRRKPLLDRPSQPPGRAPIPRGETKEQ